MAVEELKDLGTEPSASVKRWMDELKLAHQEEEDYRKEAAQLMKRYRSEDKIPFNILWSNVETLKPTVYSNTPQPDIRRRFRDRSPVARQASMVLERSISYMIDCFDFDEAVRNVRDESLITGRGVPWVVYEPEILEIEEPALIDPLSGEIVQEATTREALGEQKVTVEYVNYEDFRMSPSKSWQENRWVARKHKPTKAQGLEQFGDIFEKVPLNESLRKEDGEDTPEYFKRACVWEIWDKDSGKRIWVAENFKDRVLAEEEDPYQLRNFFPCPKPLYAYTTPGNMVPRAEYEVYRKQAMVVNETSQKINDLVYELKVAGVYPDVMQSFEKLAQAKNGELIGEAMSLGLNTAIKDMISWWPFEQIASVLISLYEARDRAIQTIYEITGISDIVRGATNAQETAAAQQLKGNFSSMRMVPRQQPMQEMVRDLFRIMAEIIAEQFTAENLQNMTGLQIDSEVMMLLRNDKMRGFQIDVETDTTVQADADREKQRRVEFLTAMSEFIGQVAPLVQGGMLPAEAAKAMLGFAVRGFKVGRELEDAIESLGDSKQQGPSMQEQLAQMQMQLEAEKQRVETEAKKAQIANDRYELAMQEQQQQQDNAFKAIELSQDAKALQAKITNDQQRLNLDAAKANEQAAVNSQKLNIEAIKGVSNVDI